MKPLYFTALRTVVLASFVGGASAVTGCSAADAEDILPSNVHVTDRSSSALVADLESIDGVYGAGCAGHTANEPWSVGVAANAPLSNAALRVRRNDTSCTLELTAVRSATKTFTATPKVALAGAFAAPSAFNDDAQSAVDFYGSAKLGDPTFANNFSIELLLTDATNEGEPKTEFPDGYEHSFTATQGNVPAPDFSYSTGDHTLLTDENNIVTTSSGYVQLVVNSRAAQSYAVVHGVLSNGMSPADLASAMQSAPHGGAISTPYRIPAADLDLVGVDLTPGVSRTIILRNTEHGLSSYQVIRIKFSPRPSWAPKAWSACSATCGGGTQTRAVKCEVNGVGVDPTECLGAPPATEQSCNEGSCQVDVGAFHADGSCGVLGVQGPGFVLTAGPTAPLPAGTVVNVTGSGVANIGVFSVSGGTATVSVLSATTRQIVLTSALPAGAQIAFRTTLSISVAFTLNATVTLPDGSIATGAKTSGNVTSTLVMCTGS